MMDAEPTDPVGSMATKRKPTFMLVMVTDFHTQPSSPNTWTAVSQPSKRRRCAVKCWAPP